jgi:hypothetical protein
VEFDTGLTINIKNGENMASNVGKISGQMLRDDLLRNGVDLAFETDLIYLDVNSRKVGIKTTTPSHDLTVNGTTRTTVLEVLNSATIDDIVIDNNQIYSTTGTLNLNPTVGGHVVYQNKLLVDDIQIEGNQIATVNSNADLNFTTSGTGKINLNGNTEVIGNLHATGTITADGNLQLGDSDTDSITFNADIASNIIPDIDNTFQLGDSLKRWKDIWVDTLHADAVVTGAITVAGIDIALNQGNIYYVAVNGDDGNSGTHQNDPLSSVGRALDLATAGDTVYIYPGTYSEALPLTVPVGVTVKGAGIRSVTIEPDSDVTVDVFLLNGETTVEDLTISGFEFDSGTNTGYAFRFAPNITVTSRSPYIRNVSVITAGSTVRLMTNPPTDPRGFLSADAGKGAYLDGSIVNAASREASMLFHSVTFITPGVDAITMTNGVRVEWLNSFTYFANRGLYAVSGSAGFAGDGKTRLKVYGISAQTLNVGDTITVENVSANPATSTTGTIESFTYAAPYTNIVIDGKVSGFEESLSPPDTENQQVITFSGGQTASHLAWADYSDFGAEIRSIASASVYGNYGAYGDGEGVIAYLIGTNLAYIGSGRYADNDPINVIQANEVVELNRARIYYTSVDAQGDFRVGDFFLVDQQTGTITFNPTSLEITSSTGVTFTDGVNTTLVTPTKIETGNIRISGNTIQSLSGGITLTAANNQLTFTSNATITGTVDLQENFTVQGNTTIGDSPSDLLTINSSINSNVVPSTNAVYDLGSQTNSWRNVYLAQADIDSIRISGNLITTTNSNADLELRANGAGIVRIPNDNLVVNQNLNVLGSTTLTNATISGTLNVGSLNVSSTVQSGTFTTDDIIIQGNVIRTSLSNSNLELRANGSGAVLFENLSVQGSTISGLVPGQDIEFTPSGPGVFKINSDQALTLPIGSDVQRPASPQAGMIRFNNTVNQFEGYTGTAWIQFGSVIDADRNTYVIPELSPGSNENTLYFVADGNLAATLDSNQFNVNKLLVDQIEIDGNIIRTTSSNTDLELRPNGTGAVVIDGFRITTNTITNTNLNAVTTLQSTGSGYFNIVGTNAVVIPSGNDFQRPGSPQLGMMRYSTSLGFVEIWDGSAWISVAGTGAGINADQAAEIAIERVLIFG